MPPDGPDTLAMLQALAATLAARVEALERELDALRTELMHAVDALPRKVRERYTREREARGGPLP